MREQPRTLEKEPLEHVNGLFVDRETGEIVEVAKHYLEFYDKLHNFPAYQPSNKPHPNCLNGYVSGKCSNGHGWAKAIYCDKEWCPDCGAKHSPVHQRRIARWFDKVMSFDSLGYLVVTVPTEAREDFYDKTVLSAYRLAIKRKLQEMGYDRGLSRWHWLGDCKKCRGKGCEHCKQTGASRNYNPHLNIFIGEGFLDKRQFNRVIGGLKEFCAKWIRNNLVIELEHPVTIHYQFTEDKDKKAHLLSYCTRATLRHDIRKIRETVYRYRSTNSWGVFPDSEQPATDPGMILEKGRCPCCGERVVYEQFTATKYFPHPREDIVNLSCGYVKLPDEVAPVQPPAPDRYKLLSYGQN